MKYISAAYTDDIGDFHIVGEVQNTSNQTIKSVQLVVQSLIQHTLSSVLPQDTQILMCLGLEKDLLFHFLLQV
jgi:hypothetical protein